MFEGNGRSSTMAGLNLAHKGRIRMPFYDKRTSLLHYYICCHRKIIYCTGLRKSGEKANKSAHAFWSKINWSIDVSPTNIYTTDIWPTGIGLPDIWLKDISLTSIGLPDICLQTFGFRYWTA